MEVIIHNSISLDGSLINFEPNMNLHYQIAGNYNPDAHLIGSNTLKKSIELFEEEIPSEEEKDFQKPERNLYLPYWVVPDTEGKLKGLLHIFRRFEYCRDIIVLTSDKTPKEYIHYLKERNYDFYTVGKDHVDLKASFELLSAKYNVKKILADTGRILGNILLEHGLVSEISLLIYPIIVGKSSFNIFGNINKKISLRLQMTETFDGGYVLLVYKVK